MPEVVARHAEAIRERWGGLDWLVLNAGIGDAVDARRFSAERYHEVFATNVGGAVNWLGAVLPGMIEAGHGTVAGISSLAAWRGLPGAGAYSASKAALATLLESTRVDLRGTGVRVVTVFPGFIRNRGVRHGRGPGQAVPARPVRRRAAHPRRHRERAERRALPVAAVVPDAARGPSPARAGLRLADGTPGSPPLTRLTAPTPRLVADQHEARGQGRGDQGEGGSEMESARPVLEPHAMRAVPDDDGAEETVGREDRAQGPRPPWRASPGRWCRPGRRSRRPSSSRGARRAGARLPGSRPRRDRRR